jgi:hypothetical protein
MSDRLDAIEADLERPEVLNTENGCSVANVGSGDVRWLVAEVERLREANMELRVQLRGEADARVGDLEQLSAEQASLEHDLTALRARHAEAVEKAFREGWTWLEPYCESADGAWLASEARRKVGI